MALHLHRGLFLFSTLLLTLCLCEGHVKETTAPTSDEDNESSSEETVESSSEKSHRRRRAAEMADTEHGTANASPRAGIPGIPDPATILRVAEILQTVGERVVPILLEGMPPSGLVGERVARDLKFLRNFKRELQTFSNEVAAAAGTQ